MTPYGDRRRKGEYDVGAVKTTKQDTVWDPSSGGTAVVEPTVEPDPTELTLKELQAQAEAAGVATYGTKAEIAQRIADAHTVERSAKVSAES